MSDPSENNETSSEPSPQSEGSLRAPGFRIGNVLKVVLPLAFLGGAGVVFVGLFDGLNLLSHMTDPALVSGSGQVMYQGQPLEDAIVTTRHTSGKVHGSIGWTDEQGQFKFQTDINGYVDGAYAGEHQVIVTGYQRLSTVPGPPPLVTPRIYASFETTPLRVTLSDAAEENKFVFTLEGEPPERPSANLGGGGGFDPEAIVGRVLEEFDKDGDDQLSDDEMQAIASDRAERIRQADTDEDGVVDRDELLQALSARRRPESE